MTNGRDEMLRRYKLRKQREAQIKQQRHVAMLKRDIPKLQQLIRQYKHVKSILDDRVNPRRFQNPRNYQDYLEKYVNKIRYRENNHNRYENNYNSNN